MSFEHFTKKVINSVCCDKFKEAIEKKMVTLEWKCCPYCKSNIDIKEINMVRHVERDGSVLEMPLGD